MSENDNPSSVVKVLDQLADETPNPDNIRRRVNPGELDTCPYIIGVECNQKSILCDKGHFEAHCVMLALRQIDHAIESKHEYFINEGITRACHVLLHKEFLKKKYEDYSSERLKDEVLKILEDAKKKGHEWHRVGFEELFK